MENWYEMTPGFTLLFNKYLSRAQVSGPTNCGGEGSWEWRQGAGGRRQIYLPVLEDESEALDW